MLLLFASMAVFLVLLEIFVRVFGIAPQYGPLKMFEKDEQLDFRMIPNFKGKFVKQEFEIEIHTNSYGLRDEEYSGKKPNDYNILALGDSFTWGAYGTELNQTFAKILEKKLNDNSKSIDYRVINAGVPSYGTDQQLAYLKTHGKKFEPDMVLLNFFVGNDFFDNAQKNELTVKSNLLVTNKLELGKTEKLRNFLLLNFHSYRIIEKGTTSLFANFIQKNIKGKIQYWEKEAELFIKPLNEDAKKQFEMTREILDEMNSYLKPRNIKFVIAVIPLNYQVNDDLKQSFIKNNLGDKEFDIEQPQKVITEWAKENNIFVIDLLPYLAELEKDHDLYWKLNAHFNVEGNEAVANIIFENLSNNKALVTRAK